MEMMLYIDPQLHKLTFSQLDTMLVHDRPHVDNLYSDPKYSPVPTGFVTDLYPEDPPAHASSGVEAMDNNQYPGYHNTGADPASTGKR